MDVSGSSVSGQAAARSSRPMKANRSATCPSSARTSRRPAPARPFRSTNLRQPSIRNSRASRNDVNSRSTRTLAAALAVILVGEAQQLLGYALENETWPGPTIPVVIEIVPSSFTLQHGSLTYHAVVENALGLDHPDEAHPRQDVEAIMNSNTSDLDHLAADDIDGGQFLYGQPVNAPPPTGNGRPANISTRASVGTGDNVMIGGFIIHDASKQVLIRALGPALTSYGVSGVLADPSLELHNSVGDLITTNNNWPNSHEHANATTTR